MSTRDHDDDDRPKCVQKAKCSQRTQQTKVITWQRPLFLILSCLLCFVLLLLLSSFYLTSRPGPERGPLRPFLSSHTHYCDRQPTVAPSLLFYPIVPPAHTLADTIATAAPAHSPYTHILHILHPHPPSNPNPQRPNHRTRFNTRPWSRSSKSPRRTRMLMARTMAGWL